MSSKIHRLATQVAAKRRSLESAIRKLAAENFEVGTGAAQHSALMLGNLSIELMSTEIERLRTNVKAYPTPDTAKIK